MNIYILEAKGVNLILLIISKISKKQKDIIENIYIRLRSTMYGTALNILRDTYDAEDAVSNTFIKISQKYQQLDHIKSDEIDKYCMAILKNESYKIYNKRKRETPSEIIEDTNINYTAESEILKILDKDQIEDLMKNLEEEEKTFLILRYYRGWTFEEISKFLGITNSTARKRHQRILEKLRKEEI